MFHFLSHQSQIVLNFRFFFNLRFREHLRFQEISDWLKTENSSLFFETRVRFSADIRIRLRRHDRGLCGRVIDFARSRLTRARVHLFKFWTPFSTILPMVCQVWLTLFADAVIILRALKEEVETVPGIINRSNLRLHRPNRYPKTPQCGLNGFTHRHSEKHPDNQLNSHACGWSPKRYFSLLTSISLNTYWNPNFRKSFLLWKFFSQRPIFIISTSKN